MATVDEILKLQEQQPSDVEDILKLQGSDELKSAQYIPQEERPLIDVPGLRDISTPSQWYGGLENIGYGPAKLASHIATPVLESVRGALRGTAQLVGRDVKYQAPEPSVFAEFTEPKTGYGFGLPSSKATTSNILTDVSNIMGIEQQPLAKVTSKDYPKAAAFAEQLTNPAVAGGAALDIALAKKIPSPERIGGNLNMSLETAADYVRSLAKNDKQLLELEKTGKIYQIADMVRKNPDAYLHQFRPNKIYEEIMGPIVKEDGRRLYEQGGLNIAGEAQKKFINELPTNAYSVPKEELQRSALAELNKTTMEAGQKSQAEEIIKRNIPITQPSEEKLSRIRKIGDLATEYKDIRDNHPDEIPNPEYVEKTAIGSGGMVVSNEKPKTIPNQHKITKLAELEQQMIDLGAKDPHGSSPESYIERIQKLNEEPVGYASEIRQLGNKLMEPPVPGETSTDIAAKNLAGRAMEKAARTSQDVIMEGSNLNDVDVQAYHEKNKNISNMMIMRDLMEGNLVGDSYAGMEYIPTGITGKSGLPNLLAKGMGRFIKPTASEIAASARTGGQMFQATGPGMATLPTVEAQKIMSNQQNQGRSPQSISPIQAQAMSRGLVENLADYEVPRDTKAILANKQAVLAKIAQVTNDPRLIAQLDDGLNKHPDKLEPLVQMISLQFPNLFETDVYNRINGKIFHPDPMVKQQIIQKAYKDVEHKAKNNTEKVLLQNGLNRDGSLPPSFQ